MKVICGVCDKEFTVLNESTIKYPDGRTMLLISFETHEDCEDE